MPVRVLIVRTDGKVERVETSHKYLLKAGHELLGDKYLQYQGHDGDLYVVYDDDAMLKGEPMGPLGYYGDVLVAHVVDSDDNDLIIGDLVDAIVQRITVRV